MLSRSEKSRRRVSLDRLCEWLPASNHTSQLVALPTKKLDGFENVPLFDDPVGAPPPMVRGAAFFVTHGDPPDVCVFVPSIYSLQGAWTAV